MKTLDQALESFTNYKETYQRYIDLDLSETDTRSKLIDLMLIDVLGWSENDIEREGSVDSGYYDYKVSIPGIYFILEAKKQFKEFVLPSSHKRSSLKSLLKGNNEVIMQIRKYTFDEGIQYGIITNGYQFILLKTFNNDNKPWKDNIALLFHGIQDVEDRFVEFYDNLSKYSIISNGGFKFDLPINDIEYKTIISSLIDKEKELIRNPLSASIKPLIDSVFGEIFSEEKEDDKNFIEYCFIENEETKKNKNEIERLFGDYAPNLSNVAKVVNSNSLAHQISDEINSDEIAITNTAPPKPIIIIGSKGAGKTTFLNHLFKYKLKNEELENHFIVYIDFRKFFETDLTFEPNRIAADILETLYTKYEELELHSLKVLKRVYIKEIKRNDENIWLEDKHNDPSAYQKKLSFFLEFSLSNALNHLEALSKYIIRERRKRLIIIIDNADQLKDTIQEKLFVFSHALTKSCLCGTVISLREGYYYKWQNSPPFDAYESNVYHITAPSYAEILQKRIDFALDNANIYEKRIRGANNRGITFEFSSQDILSFLSSLKFSLFSATNSKLIDFLNHTTYPNIREGLRIFKSFLTSGHTNVQEYILREKYRNEQKSFHQVIPIHEFIKTIALQNKHYYNSEISSINNLFIPPVDSTDHFIKINILQFLNELIEKHNYTNKFITNNLLIEKMNSLGYRTNLVQAAISQLIKSSMIDSDEQLSDIDWISLPKEYNVSLTAKGHYYLVELINRFHYFDLVLQDCPIFDTNVYEEIKTNFPPSNEIGLRNLNNRILCVKKFVEYILDMSTKQSSQVKAAYGQLIERVCSSIINDIRSIPSSALQHTGK